MFSNVRQSPRQGEDSQNRNQELKKRQLPKLFACMTKQSLENMRNKALFSIDALDAKSIRRRKKPLHECLILELKEAGYTESSSYLQDLLYDNAQLVAEDDIGIVVDLTKRDDYLEHICSRLQVAERERERKQTKEECLALLNLALWYEEKGKGILWLAEKFFLAAIAVSSRYMLDGGRLKGVCKYHYATFLLNKFPGADPEEPFLILTEVRDYSIGKEWPLYEPEREGEEVPEGSLFRAASIQLQRVLLEKSRAIRKADPGKGERLARLAERRGMDTNLAPLIAEAIIEVGICQLMMNNLNNAKKTFHRAYDVNAEINNIEGLCTVRMHLAAVMQRLGDHKTAATLLTEMGALAMEHGLRLQLGRALHLLGELHLRRERPDLGTEHLREAFFCFMGCFASKKETLSVDDKSSEAKSMGIAYREDSGEVYKEEAEQSRLMTAVSAGQELMPSYFDLLKGARHCAVDTIKCIEWKLSNAAWNIERSYHDLIPCLCNVHNRTPLDVLWTQIKKQTSEENEMESNVIIDGDDEVNTIDIDVASSTENQKKSKTTSFSKEKVEQDDPEKKKDADSAKANDA